ncbi:10851_t:CDS:2, partial [Scutellospora calospora]
DELLMALKGNIEAVDTFFLELNNNNILFGGKIFIGLESIKSSSIWNLFEVYDLQQP